MHPSSPSLLDADDDGVELASLRATDERGPLVVVELERRAVRVLAVPDGDPHRVACDEHAGLGVVLAPRRLHEVGIAEPVLGITNHTHLKEKELVSS